MATFTAGTSFTDGVTGDVTAAKLNALVANATPLSNFITDRTAETSIATDDLVLISDTSDSGALNKMTVANFTNVVSTGTGTAASPAIRPTGDTNTGIFFPAADTIAFSEGGTEAMRIDSSGRVGIGTSSPSSLAGVSRLLHIEGTTAGFRANGTTGSVSVETYSGASLGYTGTSSNHGFVITTNNTERLRIDSSGNVGIGTTPSHLLQIYGANPDIVAIHNGANASRAYMTADNSAAYFGSHYGSSNIPIIFTQAGIGSSAIERLRITSGGEVYIAGTTDQGAYNLQVNGTGVWGAGAYVNGSDERLKENIQDITSGLDVVEKLRPVSFQYKEDYTADRSVQSGFIAQDLLVALEGKNYLEGVVSQGPTYYNVAYQNLIPILAKAIQELKAENDSLKSRIASLEAA